MTEPGKEMEEHLEKVTAALRAAQLPRTPAAAQAVLLVGIFELRLMGVSKADIHSVMDRALAMALPA